MADKEQQIKNSFIYLLPIIISNLLPFITLPIFTRILTREDYGVLALAQVYAIFVTGLANFGMTVSYDRNYFQYRGNRLETANLLYSTLLFVILSFLFFASLTYLFKGTFSKLIIGSAEHANILFWAFCAQFFSSVNYYYLAYFKNSETAKKFVVYTIAGSLITIIISLYLIVYLRIGVIGMVYAQLCSGTLVFAILTYKFTNIFPITFSKPIFVESLKISYPLTPRIFLGVIGSQFDKYMIGLLASAGGVGIYSIAQKVAYITFSYMTALENVYAPQVYKRMFDLGNKGGEAVGRYLTPFAYISILITLMISLFSQEIITLLTPSSYHGAIDIVTVLSMLYGSYFFGKQPQLIFAKKTWITSALTLLTITLNIAINIPFIMKWGAIGAAWATLTAGVISCSISFGISQHYYRIKWEYGKLAYIFLTFFGFSILIILLRDMNAAYSVLLGVKIIAVMIYVLIGIKIRVITMENWMLVKDMLSNLKTRFSLLGNSQS